MSDRDDMNRYLETLAPAAANACEIITPNDILGGRLFHISTNTDIRKFVPIIGLRQANSEDRTMPRVCTAPTLLGCLIGFGAADHHFREYKSTGEEKDRFYKGGFKIYGFDFEHAIRPKKSLVYDQPKSDECWLVAYNKATSEYRPITFGKLFYHSIKYTGRTGHAPYDVMEIYVDVQHDDGIRWGADKVLTRGYWKIVGPEALQAGDWKIKDAYTFEQITRTDYLQLKDLSAGLLSHNLEPSFMNW